MRACIVYCINVTTYSLVLLEKLIVPHLVKKFTAFYGTLRFVTTFTRARRLSLP